MNVTTTKDSKTNIACKASRMQLRHNKDQKSTINRNTQSF